MRIAVLVLVACSTPARPVAPVRQGHACSSAEWTEIAETPRRAWIAHAKVPVSIVDVAGWDIEVASITPSVIATRWVPYSSLERAAMSTVAVSPQPGAPADPAIRITKGHRLGDVRDGWAAVHEPEGFVPAAVVGLTWTEPEVADDDLVSTLLDVGPTRVEAGPLVRDPSGTLTYRWAPRTPHDRRYLRYVTGDVRLAPDDTAPLRIALALPTVAQMRRAQGEWVEVTVLTLFAELDGFWKIPPPAPASDSAEIDMPGPHSPIAAWTCLYDAPHGHVVGMVRDEDAFARPVATKIKGWYTATIPTAWGTATYYTDAPPVPPPTPTPQTEWPFESTGEWR